MIKDKINFILILFLILGISLLLYPSVADLWNASRSTKIISSYSDSLTSMSDKEIEDTLKEARRYNEKIKNRGYKAELTEEELEDYYSHLKFGATDVMATVEIPSINVKLPVYHSTKETVLQTSLGHLEWTSLPVGGKGSHATITGHRGLISARLFTDLDQLAPGDLFYINVLREKLAYQVDKITIVEPHEIQNLVVDPEEDYVTLLTCTPYGINTHRLLVRGKRIDSKKVKLKLNSEAVRIRPLIVASVMMIPISILFALLVIVLDKKRRRDE